MVSSLVSPTEGQGQPHQVCTAVKTVGSWTQPTETGCQMNACVSVQERSTKLQRRRPSAGAKDQSSRLKSQSSSRQSHCLPAFFTGNCALPSAKQAASSGPSKESPAEQEPVAPPPGVAKTRTSSHRSSLYFSQDRVHCPLWTKQPRRRQTLLPPCFLHRL